MNLKLIGDPITGNSTGIPTPTGEHTTTPAPTGGIGGQPAPTGTTDHNRKVITADLAARITNIHDAVLVLESMTVGVPADPLEVIKRFFETRDLLVRSLDILDGRRGSIGG